MRATRATHAEIRPAAYPYRVVTRLALVAVLLAVTHPLIHDADRKTPDPAPAAARVAVVPPSPEIIEVAGDRWIQVLEWEASNGWYPGGWGWGAWRLENDVLVGSDPDSMLPGAVYFLPFVHGSDFMMETTARMRAPWDSEPTEIHLLTRDNPTVRFESGGALIAESDSVRVRCFAEGVDRLYGAVPVERPPAYGEWYVMRYLLRGGRVVALVDDEIVFDSASNDDAWASSRRLYDADVIFPEDVFREPHIAVRNGEAEFRSFRIWIPVDDPTRVDPGTGATDAPEIARSGG
jgi:hypothetical protein